MMKRSLSASLGLVHWQRPSYLSSVKLRSKVADCSSEVVRFLLCITSFYSYSTHFYNGLGSSLILSGHAGDLQLCSWGSCLQQSSDMYYKIFPPPFRPWEKQWFRCRISYFQKKIYLVFSFSIWIDSLLTK